MRIEQAMDRALFPETEKGRFYVRFNLDGLIRGDYKSRMEGYAIAQVAHDFGVPVELIKHVSDSADETSGDVWAGRAAELAEEIAGHARSRATR